jgi:hypothetical protein
MSLESTFQYPDDLNAAWPIAGDNVSDGAGHLRGIKNVIQNTCKRLDGNDLSAGLMTTLYPVGSISIGIPFASSKPDDDYGGTWGKLGVIAMDGTSHDGGTPLLTELWVWQRTA